MKRLSDYTGAEAIEIWGDLLDPMMEIFSDKEIVEDIQEDKQMIIPARKILKTHSESVEKLLLRIDPTPLNGLNVVFRVVGFLTDIGSNGDMTDFFEFAEQANKEKKYSGSPTESIEGEEK